MIILLLLIIIFFGYLSGYIVSLYALAVYVDPDEIDNPLSDENLMKDVGRGIFIVRSLMDKVEVHPTDTGTAVTISKDVG